MDLSKLPKPIVYSLSLVLLAIGLSITYQVVLGSHLSYDGPLGSIKVGSGENQTTLSQFLSESEAALEDAQVTIGEQNRLIEKLKASVSTYRKEVASLKTLASKLRSSNSSDDSRRIVSADINRTIASLDLSERKLAQLKAPVTQAQTVKRLELQANLTRDVKQTISNTRAEALRKE